MPAPAKIIAYQRPNGFRVDVTAPAGMDRARLSAIVNAVRDAVAATIDQADEPDPGDLPNPQAFPLTGWIPEGRQTIKRD